MDVACSNHGEINHNEGTVSHTEGGSDISTGNSNKAMPIFWGSWGSEERIFLNKGELILSRQPQSKAYKNGEENGNRIKAGGKGIELLCRQDSFVSLKNVDCESPEKQKCTLNQRQSREHSHMGRSLYTK